MEEYRKQRAIAVARKQLELLNVTQEHLEEFDALCRDFDLTIADLNGDLNSPFYNPQEHERDELTCP